MPLKSADLAVATPNAWVPAVLGDLDAFIADHANCERKASAMAMGMVVKYPDREAIVPGLIDIAREELEHFAQVHAIMRERGIALVRDERDDYVAGLLAFARHGRDERLLDRLLVASVVECRGAERFGLVAAHVPDPALAAFYARLRNAEVKHGHVFVDLALGCFAADVVYSRLGEFIEHEGRLMPTLPLRPALH